MKPLTIELTKGELRQLQSVGWKAPSREDCRRYFYALDQTGQPLVITPKPAMPEFYDPNLRAKPVFSREPFPEAVCVKIVPCRLLAPPCYKSRPDFEAQLPCHSTFEPWKWVYLQTHDQVLILETSDDGPLQERLDKWLAAMRVAYERETALWRDRIKHVTTASLNELGFETEEQRGKRLAEYRGQLDIVESERPIDGVPCKGRLSLTMEDVKLGREGIRDAWMHEDWANKNGEDLGLMARARRAFRRWLEIHTGTRANIIDATTHPSQLRQGIAPPSFGEGFDSDPRFLEACARVRYRAHFADNANTVVYLADCETRAELTSPELDEVTKLKGGMQTGQAASLVNLRHSQDYRQIFWTENSKKERADLTKKQASAFSALHNAEGLVLARDEWRQEIYGEEPPSDFRPDKIFAYKDGRKVWDRFIRVYGDRYRLVIEPE